MNYIKQFTPSEIERIHHRVLIGINTVTQLGFPKHQVLLQVPKYFIDMMMYKTTVNTSPVSIFENETTYFGKKILPSFGNFIVVYHEDMPLLREAKQVIITL